MKRLAAYIYSLFVIFSAYSADWAENICSQIDRLADGTISETSQVGIMVYDLTADSYLYGRNPRHLMRPASTMKLLTAITALSTLGSSHRFSTSLYYRGTIFNNTFNGDIYCQGGYDPLFNGDDLTAFIEAIRRLGADTIRGHLVEVAATNANSSTKRWGPGWCWDDENPSRAPLLISGDDSFLFRLSNELRLAGLVVEAPRTEGSLPPDAYHLSTRYHTMSQVLMRMMKHSDNQCAESLFMSLGTNPATKVTSLIRSFGYDPTLYSIADGSGLSLYNYISPELLVRFLRYAYENSNIFDALYASLPIASCDGTLKRRMAKTTAAANVRAKTGTLSAISSLAGYCRASNGHLLCFAIINQGVMKSSEGRHFQDRLCIILTQ